MQRYGVIREKRPREIVLLRTTGCAYRKCAFCDYHLDRSPDTDANLALNRSVLDRVTGEFGEIEILDSGSVFDFDEPTLELIRQVCRERGIKVIHFESHYLYRDRIPALRAAFSDFDLKLKLGLETFDADLRERVLRKGIVRGDAPRGSEGTTGDGGLLGACLRDVGGCAAASNEGGFVAAPVPETDPAVIAEHFDEANFLFGLTGQTRASMERDVELGLEHFERICVNVMCANSTKIRPDEAVVAEFMEHLYPRLRDDLRADVLVENTDFGVGD